MPEHLLPLILLITTCFILQKPFLITGYSRRFTLSSITVDPVRFIQRSNTDVPRWPYPILSINSYGIRSSGQTGPGQKGSKQVKSPGKIWNPSFLISTKTRNIDKMLKVFRLNCRRRVQKKNYMNLLQTPTSRNRELQGSRAVIIPEPETTGKQSEKESRERLLFRSLRLRVNRARMREQSGNYPQAGGYGETERE